jgi:two-component system OmpR family response regulator/two-component system response regulator RstA
MRPKILIVEDDHELATMMEDFLDGEGFQVAIESHGEVAKGRILREPFDAILLDIGLPGIDGITLCREVRSEFSGPILVVTARGEEIDEVVALEVGADDYMAKPVRPRALSARLKSHLRRKELVPTVHACSRIDAAGLHIDASNRTVELHGQSIVLTTAEFDLLWYLAERAGNVVERSDIYQSIIGIPYDGMDRSIDLRVSRLRKKIGDDPHHPERIKSIRGVGYLLAVVSREDVSKEDVSKEDVSKEDVSREEAVSKEAASNEEVSNAVSKDSVDSVSKDSVSKDSVSKDSVLRDSVLRGSVLRDSETKDDS